MEKPVASILALAGFCLLYTSAIAAQTGARAGGSLFDAAKEQVQKLGFGRRVKVKLQNGTKVRGRITGLADDHFLVSDTETGATINVRYSDVTKIDKQRQMPKFLKGAFMGVVITAAVVGTLTVLALLFPD